MNNHKMHLQIHQKLASQKQTSELSILIITKSNLRLAGLLPNEFHSYPELLLALKLWMM